MKTPDTVTFTWVAVDAFIERLKSRREDAEAGKLPFRELERMSAAEKNAYLNGWAQGLDDALVGMEYMLADSLTDKGGEK